MLHVAESLPPVVSDDAWLEKQREKFQLVSLLEHAVNTRHKKTQKQQVSTLYVLCVFVCAGENSSGIIP